jgi:hypothetical protein
VPWLAGVAGSIPAGSAMKLPEYTMCMTPEEKAVFSVAPERALMNWEGRARTVALSDQIVLHMRLPDGSLYKTITPTT